MMANDGHIAKDTLFEPERQRARAIDWDQSDRGLSSGRAATVLQSRRRIHGRSRNHASFNRDALAPREPSIHGSRNSGDAYRSEEMEAKLFARGLKSRIHRKGKRGKPLNEQGKSSNRTRSAVRARVEHVFGAQTNDMGGTLLRSIGLIRARARIGMKNLACNMRRLVQFRRLNPSPA